MPVITHNSTKINNYCVINVNRNPTI